MYHSELSDETGSKQMEGLASSEKEGSVAVVTMDGAQAEQGSDNPEEEEEPGTGEHVGVQAGGGDLEKEVSVSADDSNRQGASNSAGGNSDNSTIDTRAEPHAVVQASRAGRGNQNMVAAQTKEQQELEAFEKAKQHFLTVMRESGHLYTREFMLEKCLKHTREHIFPKMKFILTERNMKQLIHFLVLIWQFDSRVIGENQRFVALIEEIALRCRKELNDKRSNVTTEVKKAFIGKGRGVLSCDLFHIMYSWQFGV